MSRKFFRSVFMDDQRVEKDRDELLLHLCTSKTFRDHSICQERELYRLSRDFPVLRQRIAVLQAHLMNLKPRGWREIWKDRRDSVQWYTFWAVIAFGGVSVFLGVLQTIFAAIQAFSKS